MRFPRATRLVREGSAVMYAAIADWAAAKQYSITFMCAQLGPGALGLLPLADRGAMPA